MEWGATDAKLQLCPRRYGWNHGPKSPNNMIILSNFTLKLLRCQAQLELTFMMCLSDHSTSTGAISDRSTFTLIDTRAIDLHHCFFFGGLIVV